MGCKQCLPCPDIPAAVEQLSIHADRPCDNRQEWPWPDFAIWRDVTASKDIMWHGRRNYGTKHTTRGDPGVSRGLMSGFAAAGRLRLQGRIPPGAWMFLSWNVLCCVIEVSVTRRSLVQRSPTECVYVCVCVCVTEYDQGQLWPPTRTCQTKITFT